MEVPTISPQQFRMQCQDGQDVELIDVRTPAEFREIHLTQAKNVPLDRLDVDTIQRMRVDAGKPLFIVCRSGARGRQACEKLLRGGVDVVVNIDGGTLACAEAGLPVERGQKTLSLERQVRICAGVFTFIGALLGYVSSPLWFVVPAIMGLGLAYAGVTDRCGMGIMLAYAPWNRSQASSSCQSE
ncbi:MAG: rhodanese-like domain-containing protein [Planctomycetales bacterium]|nr:rhodanese-like domain-containing protein [Planctomycetales bacterium]